MNRALPPAALSRGGSQGRRGPSFAAAIRLANNRISRVARKMELRRTGKGARETKEKVAQSYTEGEEEKEGERACMSSLLNYDGLFWLKLYRDEWFARRLANSRPTVLLIYEDSYRESRAARATRGFGRSPAIYFANCKSSSDQVLLLLLFESSVLNVVHSARAYAAARLHTGA